jgi:hypothetical protein
MIMEHMYLKKATIQDHPRLKKLYDTYYPANHPLYHITFWEWMFGNPSYGTCWIVADDNDEVIGHMGAIKGGEMVWLVNILIKKIYSGKGITTMLMDAARASGPLAVAVANKAGAALLHKKNWLEHPQLERWIWTMPGSSYQKDPAFFSPIPLLPDLPKPDGYFWQQPFLQSIQFPWGDVASLSKKSGGLRLVSINNPSACIKWACEYGIMWMDWVGQTNFDTQRLLLKNGFAHLDDFPWYVDPIERSRNVELNLFSENPFPEGFKFYRNYADLTRIGYIDSTSMDF